MQQQSNTSVAPWVFSCETLRDPKNPLVLTITFTIKMGPEGPPLHFAKACWIPWSTGYPHEFPIQASLWYPPIKLAPYPQTKWNQAATAPRPFHLQPQLLVSSMLFRKSMCRYYVKTNTFIQIIHTYILYIHRHTWICRCCEIDRAY